MKRKTYTHGQHLFEFESGMQREARHKKHIGTGAHIVATWNVNSIRARLDAVLSWLSKTQVDVLCLQETKVKDELFPESGFTEEGFHAVFHGQSKYNGVAIVSKKRLADVSTGVDGLGREARLIAGTLENIRVINVYVPNAKAVNDPTFSSKVAWLRALGQYIRSAHEEHDHILLCGDFNVAPCDSDVHASLKTIGETFVHPDVRGAMEEVTSGRLSDVYASHEGEGRKYTWWDYRMNSFARDVGMRLDHIYADDLLARCCTTALVDTDTRGMERPSDHAAVLASFNLSALP